MAQNVRRKAYIAEMLGHEIKSPLHSLVSFVKDEQAVSYINRIRRAIERFANIESELAGLEGEVQFYDLNAFLVTYINNSIEHQGIADIDYKAGHFSKKAYTSLEDLEIVLDHLIHNAAHGWKLMLLN